MNRARLLTSLITVSVFSLLSVVSSVHGQDSTSAPGPVSVASRVNWETQRIHIRLSADTLAESGLSSSGAYTTERRLEQFLPDAVVSSLAPVVVESSQNIRKVVENDRSMINNILLLPEEMSRESRRFSRDLTTVEVEYALPIFPCLSDILHTHTVSVPVPRRPAWTPAIEYTGLIIYAAELLPVHGENTEEYIQPAIFPRILDSSTQPVLDRTMVNQQHLSRWGVVGYSSSFDENKYLNRIGPRPLRVMATGIFGTNRTDVMISEHSAGVLLSTETGRKLLSQGKVIIVVGSEQIVNHHGESQSEE
jgi:hypothetical protein